ASGACVPSWSRASTSLLLCRRVCLHKHAEFLARVVWFLGDELAQADGPPGLDEAPAAALGPGVLGRGRVARVLLTVPDVVHALVGRDLPPAAGHVVQSPGVGLARLDLQRRLEPRGPGAVLVPVLLREPRVGRA